MPIKIATRPYVSSSRVIRYRRDEGFRQQVKEGARRAYRRKAGVMLDDCLYSLKFLDQAGHVEDVKFRSGEVRRERIFYLRDCADVLQKQYQTVWKWIENGMIPRAVLKAKFQFRRVNEVYHVEEVRVLIEEIGRHEKTVAYYRKDHAEVRERIEQRFREVRSKLGI